MAWSIANIREQGVRKLMGYRKAKPFARLCWIELNSQFLVDRYSTGVSNITIRLCRYVEQFRNGKGIERRAFPTRISGAKDDISRLPLDHRNRIFAAREADDGLIGPTHATRMDHLRLLSDRVTMMIALAHRGGNWLSG